MTNHNYIELATMICKSLYTGWLQNIPVLNSKRRETAYNLRDSKNKLNFPLPRTNYYKRSFSYRIFVPRAFFSDFPANQPGEKALGMRLQFLLRDSVEESSLICQPWASSVPNAVRMRENCSHKEKLLSKEFVSGWQLSRSTYGQIKVRLPKQLSLFVLLSKNIFLLIAVIRKFCPPRLTIQRNVSLQRCSVQNVWPPVKCKIRFLWKLFSPDPLHIQ